MKMNIQKSRLAALIGLVLAVCLMAAMFAVPAAAAEYEITTVGKVYSGNQSTIGFLEVIQADLHGFENYTALAQAMGAMQFYPVYYDFEHNRAFVAATGTDIMLDRYEKVTGYSLAEKIDFNTYYAKSGSNNIPFYSIKNPKMIDPYTGSGTKIYYNDDDVVDAVTADGLRVILDYILDLLPVVIPVFVGFIALDKGIKFLIGVLHGA